MDIEKRRLELLNLLEEILSDADLLKKHIEKCIKDIEEVKTEDDARLYDQTHDLEEQLKHIRIF